MIEDLVYRKDTLYVYLKGKCNNDDIVRLNKRIRYIVYEYNILNVIIDAQELFDDIDFVYNELTNNIMVC